MMMMMILKEWKMSGNCTCLVVASWHKKRFDSGLLVYDTIYSCGWSLMFRRNFLFLLFSKLEAAGSLEALSDRPLG
jgi:hypothetical protein